VQMILLVFTCATAYDDILLEVAIITAHWRLRPTVSGVAKRDSSVSFTSRPPHSFMNEGFTRAIFSEQDRGHPLGRFCSKTWQTVLNYSMILGSFT
jgi:hypothetical protein